MKAFFPPSSSSAGVMLAAAVRATAAPAFVEPVNETIRTSGLRDQCLAGYRAGSGYHVQDVGRQHAC